MSAKGNAAIRQWIKAIAPFWNMSTTIERSVYSKAHLVM